MEAGLLDYIREEEKKKRDAERAAQRIDPYEVYRQKKLAAEVETGWVQPGVGKAVDWEMLRKMTAAAQVPGAAFEPEAFREAAFGQLKPVSYSPLEPVMEETALRHLPGPIRRTAIAATQPEMVGIMGLLPAARAPMVAMLGAQAAGGLGAEALGATPEQTALAERFAGLAGLQRGAWLRTPLSALGITGAMGAAGLGAEAAGVPEELVMPAEMAAAVAAGQAVAPLEPRVRAGVRAARTKAGEVFLKATDEFSPAFAGIMRAAREERGGALPPPDRPEPKFGTERKVMKVPIENLEFRPDIFQARDVDPGKAYTETRVQGLIDRWDPTRLTPARVVDNPDKPGTYIVQSGHHRIEAARRLGYKELEVILVRGDVNNPADLSRLVTESYAGNYQTALPNIREDYRAFSGALDHGADIDDVMRIFGKTNKQIQDTLDMGRLGAGALDRLVVDAEVRPHAAAIGRAMRLYNINIEDANGLFKRITDAKKGTRPTEGALRDTLDKFGRKLATLPQGALPGFEGLEGGGRGGLLQLMDEHTNAVTKLRSTRNKLSRDVAAAERMFTGVGMEMEPAVREGIEKGRVKVAELDGQVVELERRLDQAFRDLTGPAVGSVQGVPSMTARMVTPGVQAEVPSSQTYETISLPSTKAIPTRPPSRMAGPAQTLRDSGVTEVIPEAPPASRPILAPGVASAQDAVARAPETKAIVDRVFPEIGGENYYGARLKVDPAGAPEKQARQLARVQDKIDEGRTPEQISDYVGARFIGEPEQLSSIIQQMLQRGYKLHQFKHALAAERADLITLDVDVGGPVSVEVQLMTPEVASNFELVHRQYEVFRDGRTPLEEGERARAELIRLKASTPAPGTVDVSTAKEVMQLHQQGLDAEAEARLQTATKGYTAQATLFGGPAPTFRAEGQAPMVQGELGAGAGERPVETTPMFEGGPAAGAPAAAPPAAPVVTPPAAGPTPETWRAAFEGEKPAPIPASKSMVTAATWRDVFQGTEVPKAGRIKVSWMEEMEPELRQFIGYSEGPGGRPPRNAPPELAPGEGPHRPLNEQIEDYYIAIPGEKAQRAAIRTLQGRTDAELDRVQVWGEQARRRARQGGFGVLVANERTPDTEWLVRFQDTDPATRAQMIKDAPPSLKAWLEDLRKPLDAEYRAMKKLDPSWQGIDDYTAYEFTVRGRRQGIKRGGLGVKQPFLIQRRTGGKTRLEILDERPDLDLATWDPVENIERRLVRGALYRQQYGLIKHMKRVGVARPRSQAPIEGWRVPRNAPAFESKPVAGGARTEPWAVPEEWAKAIESHYNPSFFSSNTPLAVAREAAATIKFVKTFGGLFQNIDYTMRLIGGAVQYRSLKPIAVMGKAWAAAFNPALARKLRTLASEDPDLVLLREEGLQKYGGMDLMGANFQEAARDLHLFRIPVVGRALKNIGNRNYMEFHAQCVEGLAKIKFQEKLAKGMDRRQAAGQAATETNLMFSSMPAWQSVFRSQGMRDLVRTFGMFSWETEAWMRMPVQLPGFTLSILVGTAAVSNLFSIAFTGKPLPLDAYKPWTINPDEDGWGKLGFNTAFLRPELPFKGPMDRKLYLDVLGQADTPVRFALAPVMGVQSRLAPLTATAGQLIQRRRWFGGQPIGNLKEFAGFMQEQVAPIPIMGFLDEHESIGWPGAGVQTSGWNVSAEPLSALMERKYEEVIGHPMKDDNPNKVAVNIMDNPTLRKIQETGQYRAQEMGVPSAEAGAEYRGYRDTWQTQIRQAVDAGQTGYVLGQLIEQANQDLASKGEALFPEERKGKPRGEKLANALEAWYAVPISTPAGVPDWETHFAIKTKLLEMYPGLEEAVRDGIARKWSDTKVRDWALRYFDAEAVRRQYYEIPAKVGMDAATQEAVKPYVQAAQGQAPLLRLKPAAVLTRMDMPEELRLPALRYLRLGDNPERKAFRQAHPELQLWFREGVPISMAEETAAEGGY